MKNFYLTTKFNKLVSTLLVLLGLKENTIGLVSAKNSSLVNFNTRNRFGIYSFKAAMAFLLMASLNAGAQTTVIDGTSAAGSFEGTFASTGWLTAQSTVNAWVVGTAAGATNGTNAAYVNSTGTAGGTWSYNNASTQANHIYRDFTYPTGQDLATLTFDLKGAPADVGFDRIRVFVCPTTVTPVAGTELTTGATQIYSNDAALAAYTTQTVGFAKANTGGTSTGRIIITWRNDGSVGAQPYTVDKVNLVTAAPSGFTAVQGGLWNSPATWAGGVVPGAGNNVTIPAGIIITVNQAISYNDLTVNGILQWGSATFAMTLNGNMLINSGGRFLPYNTVGSGQTLTVAGNFQNDGYTNLALSALTFNGSGSTLSGSGIFQGDGTNGIIRSLSFANTGSNTVSTTQNLIVTAGLAHTAGSLNTNGKLTLNNTAQVYGLSFNNQIASVAVTVMNTAAYSINPVVFGAAVTQWTNITGALNTLYVSGNNVYRCSAAASIGPAAPTHTSGIVQNLLWIGTVGTIGTPYLGIVSHTAGTQYFLGGNLYTCTTTGIPAAGYFPTHTSDTANSGGTQFLYVGSPATVTNNFDSVTGTVRSLNLTSAGSGYSNTAPSIAFSIGAVGATGAGAAAVAVLFPSVSGAVSHGFQKSGGAATISGGLTINSDQGASVLSSSHPQSSSGVGSLFTSNGGIFYTAVPTVGFAGPTALNLVTNVGSGYAAAPTVVLTGGTLVSGTALATTNFTVTVNNGQVVSVYLNASTTATYSVPPVLSLSGGTATVAWPANCWPTAIPIIGSNRQLNNFIVTNAGFGYVAAPTVGLLGGSFSVAIGGAATAPTARIALYNLTLNFFAPAAAAIVNGDDAAIPSNRKINTLALAGSGSGLNITSGLTLYGTSPLTLNASGNAPGNVLDLGGNNLNFSWSQYTGAFSTFGATNTFIRNGSMSLTGRGGASSFNYPFAGTFSWFAGSTPTVVTTGSSVTRVTVSDTAAPTNATAGTGVAIGSKAYRVQLGAGTTGTNPTVTLGFNSQDALTVTQEDLFVAEAPALSGAWTIRSIASGTGALPVTGSRTTAVVAPGPIVPTADSYYGWATIAATITNVTPLTLCANSSTFTITGTNLTGVSAVTIGGTPATSFTVVNSTTITGVVAAGTSGFVTITRSAVVTTGTQSITVNASPSAPSVSPASASVNLGGTINILATGGAGTFNWYNVATGGTAIFTGNPYSAPACASGILYVSENDGFCDGIRTAVTVTVTPTVIAASTPTFCGTGGSTTFTVTPSDASITYTWSTNGAVTFSPTTGESVSATVGATSDVFVTATNGACTATAAFSVSVYPLPSATVTTTASGVCPGTSATINSGLSAGNFSSVAITHAPRTAPVTAVTLVSANVFNVPLTSGTGDDGGWGGIPVGFPFNFFGTSYNTINVGTNGTLTFGTYNGGALADFTFTTLPSISEPFNMVAVLAMDNDLRTADGGAIKYWTEGIAPNRKFVVSYEAVKEFGDTKYSTAQAIFYETTGLIEPHITSSTNVDRVKLVGVNNGTGTVGVLAYNSGIAVTANPQNPIANPFAFRFSPPANYTTTWYADGVQIPNAPGFINPGTNVFSLVVAPTVTTTYSISYTNQTTNCTNAAGSAQVVMAIINNIAPAALAVSSAATVCAGSSANLSITNTSNGAYTNNIGSTDALTYQWQFSLDGGISWTDISGATSATATVTPTVVTQYRVNIKSCTQTEPTSSSAVTVGFTNIVDSTNGGTPRCGTGPVSVSATTTSAGAVIRWYAAASGGTALFTGSPYTPTINATTTFYAAAETTGCSSLRVAVTADVTPAPVVTLSSSSATICNGGTATVTSDAVASTYDTFSVSPTTNAVSNGNGSFTFTPTATTTYTLFFSQSTGSNCGYAVNFTVTVNPNPTITSVTASPTAMCAGGISTLTALLPSTGYSFAASTGATLDPMTGATTVLNSSNDDTPTASPASIGFNFSFNGTTYSQYSVSPDGWILLGSGTAVSSFSNTTTLTTNIPKFYPYWDDLATGTDGNVKTLVTGTPGSRIFKVQWTVTVPRNTAGASNSTFQAWLYEATGNVEYRYGTMGAQSAGSASAGYTVDATNFSSITLSTNTASTTAANDTNAGTPAVGTMYTYAPVIPGTVTWTPTTGLYTNAGATAGNEYTGTSATTVYAKPNATTTYFATATSVAGCPTTSAGVVVTINTDPVENITGGASSLCVGGATADFNSASDLAQWSSSSPSVATVNADGIVTAVGAGTTIISAFISNIVTGCTTFATNPQTVTVYAPLSITSQPTPKSILPGGTTTFSVVASGSVASYQWKVSTNNVSFSSLTDDVMYSGTNSPTLTITNATLGITGTYYLCEVTGYAPCATLLASNSALLTVAELAISNPSNYVSCTTSTSPATFNVTVSGPYESIIWEIYNGTDWIAIDDQLLTVGAISFGGDVFSNTLVVNGLTTANNTWKVRANATAGATVVTSDEATITINIPATVSTPSDQTNCYSGGSSSFAVTTSGASGVQWQYSTNGTSWGSVANGTPDGALYTNATTATLIVATTSATPASGTYYYRALVSSASGCAAVPSASAQLFINTPSVTANASSSVFCNPGGTAVTLTGSGAGIGGTYSWSPTTGLTGTGAVVTASPTVTTLYTVTGTTASGCAKTATVTVTVSSAVTATASATPATVCSGSNSQLVAIAAGLGSTVNNYSFAASTGTFTPLVGGTNSTATGDDGSQNTIAIGFPFSYNGATATTFSINTNGFIKIGATVQGSSWVNGLGTNTNIVGAMWDDNNRGTGSISYLTTGTAPNRVLTVEWNSITIGGGGATGFPNSSFQVQLFESTNQIKMNYGGLDSSAGITASIGLSGGSAGQFLSVTPAPVATASATTANNAIASVLDIPSGTVYTFGPPTYTYSWSPSTFLSDTSIANPVATGVTATTAYVVTVTSGGGCSATANVTVTLATGIAVTTPPAAASFCQGTTATLNVVATGAGLTYQWSKNGVDVSGATAATLSILAATPADSGSYTVIINSVCGDPAVTTTAVTLTINPTPTATAPTAQTFCSGTTSAVALTGTPSGVTFDITGGTAIGLANQLGVTSIPSFTATTGTATLTLTPKANGCTGTAVTVVFTINQTPSAVTVTPSTASVCSAATSAVLLTASGGIVAPSGYCIPIVTSSGLTNDNITNFTFAGINNTTGDGPGDYNTYLSPSAVVTAGTATPFSITPNPAFGQQFRVWVDMNQNGVYEATESVFATTIESTTTVTGSITIPTTAFNGTTRIRVGDKYNSAILATEACGFSGFGEFEDYTVTISGATSPSSLVWSSSAGGLFTDAAMTTPYTGGSSATVYARPSTTATISATATVSGCTSIGTAAVTVIPSTTSSESVTACNTYTWSVNSQTYTTSGTYTFIGTNAAGCDDTKTLVLTINSSTTDTTTATGCDSYTWAAPLGNDTTYTVGGTYTNVSTNAAGCNHTQTLVLTINNSTSESASVTACDSYTWSAGTGITYSASGTYTSTSLNAAGCTHTKTLVLTINNSTSSVETVTSTTCGTYTWSVNGVTYTSSGTYTSTSTNAAGCTDTKTLVLTINPCESVVTVKMNIEGYYDTVAHAMRPVLANQGVGSSTTDVDTVTIELRDATTYALVTTTTAMLQTNGNAVATFSTAPVGSFYIAVKHRNAVQTWSASPQAVGATPLTYDFTDLASKAYSSNMKEVESGVFGFYSGDLNQDEVIDGSDSTDLINDIENFSFGLLATDLNGDGVVDGSDSTFLINNLENFIYSVHP